MPDPRPPSARTTQTPVSWRGGRINARRLRMARRQAQLPRLENGCGCRRQQAHVWNRERPGASQHWAKLRRLVRQAFEGHAAREHLAGCRHLAWRFIYDVAVYCSVGGYAAQRDVWVTGPACCLCAAEQDGVWVEARRARTTADFTAAQGVTVAGHVHPEVRPASILFFSPALSRYLAAGRLNRLAVASVSRCA